MRRSKVGEKDEENEYNCVFLSHKQLTCEYLLLRTANILSRFFAGMDTALLASPISLRQEALLARLCLH